MSTFPRSSFPEEGVKLVNFPPPTEAERRKWRIKFTALIKRVLKKYKLKHPRR